MLRYRKHDLSTIDHPMKNNTLIIGGGIVGTTLALWLSQHQHRVTLIDARPQLSDSDWQARLSQRDPRVYALSLASIDLLTQIGAWQHIQQSGRKADYQHMQVWQADGVGELNFSQADIVQTDAPNANHQSSNSRLGSMVEPSVIDHALAQMMAQPNAYLTTITGQRVTSLDWLGDGYRVGLADGRTLEGALLVGADGRGSPVRQAAGIGLDTLDYHQTAICCAIQTEQPHHATARQVFLPTGPLALLPLADVTTADQADPQHWQSVVWTLPTNRALDLLTLPDGELAQELAFASGYVLGDIRAIESIASYPLSAQHATSYSKPNLVLIGDAAHGVHPLAGQGLNLGLLDVAALADCLQQDFVRSGKQAWAGEATLRRYERLRYAHNAMMMHSFSGLNWLFGSQLPPIQQLRSEGVSLVSKLAPAMRFFSQQASGMV